MLLLYVNIMSAETPIQDLTGIDVLGKRKGGGVDMVIIVSSKLDDEDEQRMLFMQKLHNYVSESRSDEFLTEFGEGSYRIIGKLAERPDGSFIELLDKASSLLENLGIEFKYEYV